MRERVTPERYRKIAVVALASLVAIIITGGAVRLTGSGLGCSDWPTCEENQLVPNFEYHAMIEFVNRMITGIVAVAVIAAVLSAKRRDPVRSDLVTLAWGLVAGVIGQIILGAIVVFSHLNPWLVLGHFLLSMILVWNAVLLVHRAGIDDKEFTMSSSRAYRPQAWAISALASVAIFTGTLVTGSGPHAGNHEGEFIERLPFDVPDIARVHGLSVIALLSVTLATMGWLARNNAPEDEQRRIRIVLLILLGQGALGYTQYFTGVPAILVGFHIAGATALWIAVVWFHLNSAADPIDMPEKVRINNPAFSQ